ncbi:MAG: hypothetical protein NZZ41_07555 [Candidatus Dojkabacteria bacterium]|nr:hypothetical protein [Candidatus Dojkabacteria bacterium]
MPTYTVSFTNMRVLLNKTFVSTNGKTKNITVEIFKQPVEVIGKAWQEEDKFFLIRYNNEERFIYWYPSKREFNKHNEGLFCYADDNDL